MIVTSSTARTMRRRGETGSGRGWVWDVTGEQLGLRAE